MKLPFGWTHTLHSFLVNALVLIWVPAAILYAMWDTNNDATNVPVCDNMLVVLAKQAKTAKSKEQKALKAKDRVQASDCWKAQKGGLGASSIA